MGLKGMRRDLRKAGPRAQVLVREIEDEVTAWLRDGGVMMHPDSVVSMYVNEGKGAPVGTTGGIVEVSRTPLELVWRIADDAFARYVVHCCARFHGVVSFSEFSSRFSNYTPSILINCCICVQAKTHPANASPTSSDPMSLVQRSSPEPR